MFNSIGRIIAISFGLAAVLLSSQTVLAQDKAPVYIMGLSEIEPGTAAVLCKNDFIAVEDLRRADVISRIAMEKFIAPAGLDLRNEDIFVQPRAKSAGKSGSPSTSFEVTYSGFSSEAQAAFQYAADIWSMLIETSIPVHIDANWTPLGPGVLGSAGPEYVFSDFGAGEADTWYVPALANALSGADQDPESIDIVANFSSSFNSWYFGLDGNTPSGKIDFVTVVLHEIGHGLGFMGSMDVDDGGGNCAGVAGDGCWGFDGYPGMPIIYDRFAEDAGGSALMEESAYPNPSPALGSALQGGAVFFDGPASTSGNGGTPPRLYAPDEWDAGSSYSHFDESSFGGIDPNALMTPFLSASTALHDIGPVGCGLFADIGWSVTADCGLELVPQGPTVPVLTSPDDGASELSIPVTLDWRDSDRTTSYNLEVSQSASFSSVEIRTEALAASQFVLSDLLPERTYYWRVQAANSDETSPFSAVYSFSTTQAPPVAGVLISPDSSASGLPTAITLEWEAIEDADSYELQLDTVSAFTSPILDVTAVNSNNYEAADLQRETQYFWRVRGVNLGGSGAWSPVWSFTTVMFPPAAPELLFPGDDTSGVATMISLSWSGVDATDSYSAQVATDQLFQNLILNKQDLGTRAFDISGLANDKEHFWRVRGRNAGGMGEWSEVFSFTTIISAPPAPNLLSPGNHDSDVPVRAVLDWSDVPGAASYELQISQSNSFDNLVVDTSGIEVSLNEVSPLKFKEIYFWRARAVNVGGKSPWTTARTFMTKTASPAVQPSLVSPFSGATGLDLTTKLGWNPVSSAGRYDVQLSSSSSFVEPVELDTSVVTTGATVVVPEHQTRYFWRVRAANSGGEGPWSDAFYFDTGMAPPFVAPVLVSPGAEAAGLPADLVVVWEPVPGAEKYDLQVSVDSTFSHDLLSKAGLDSTSYPLRNLAYDSTYYWRVRARNSGGMGIWSVVHRFSIESEPSRVGSDRPLGMPGEFALLQNYPNPFNPQTNIQFELAGPEHVRMSIFDAGGRLIEVLVNRSMQAGRFKVEWDASGLPSGVYVCRLEAGAFRGHIPLVLMK